MQLVVFDWVFIMLIINETQRDVSPQHFCTRFDMMTHSGATCFNIKKTMSFYPTVCPLHYGSAKNNDCIRKLYIVV